MKIEIKTNTNKKVQVMVNDSSIVLILDEEPTTFSEPKVFA